MSGTAKNTRQRPQATPRPAVRPRVTTPPPAPVAAPAWPSRWHLLLPAGLRNGMEALGLWQNPTPLPPSEHLRQTLAVLERYGWCKSLDFSPTGRMCVRGGQTLLERTGHVTPHARQRAEHYMQQVLTEQGIHLQFFTWNDLPDTTFDQAANLLTRSSYRARANGE